MTSLRKWLLAAMTALALAAPLATAPAAWAYSPSPATAHSHGNLRVYYVYYRANAHSAWHFYGRYNNIGQARRAAAQLNEYGYQTFIR